MSINSGRRKRTWNYEDEPMIDQVRLLGRKDEDRFIQNLLYIKTKDAQLQLLKYRHGQRQVAKLVRSLEKQNKPVRIYILKSRQIGISSSCASMVFTKTYCQNNVDSMIIAHDKKRAAKILAMCHLFYAHLPEDLRIPLIKSSTTELRWGAINSGVEVITGGSSNASRGGTPLIVQASEIAFYRDLFGQMGSLEQAVPFIPGSIIMLETTANGAGTDAHQLWQAAGEGEVAYQQCFLDWKDDPLEQLPPFSSDLIQAAYLERIFADNPELKGRMEHYDLSPRQIGYYYETLKYKCYGDELLMCQEYPCDPEEAWISGGTPLFNAQTLGKYRMKCRDGELYIPQKNFERIHDLEVDNHLDRTSDKYIEVWEPPVGGCSYLIGADCAAGFADSDYGSAFVINRKTMNMVAEVHGRFEPDEFAKILGSMARCYNQAIVAPETDGVGLAVLACLQQFYYRIYHWRMIDAYGLKITNRLGWSTNSQSRPIMISEGKRLFKDRAKWPDTMGLFIRSKALVDELRTFVVSGMANRPSASSGCHDDRVMAWLITLICTLQEEFGTIGDETQKGSSGSTEKNRNPRMEDVFDDLTEEGYFD